MPGLEATPAALPSSLPEGNYTIIGVDIDTTGRRLIDEIVHLAAYTPEQEFSQYVMPYMNLNPAARQRHQVRVITIGFFRMLKCMQTYRVMKTTPEYAAMVRFMQWLEEQKDARAECEGLILLYHEQRNFVPYMILEAVKKYDMMERFERSVKGFANMYSLAEKECGATLKYFTLRELSKVILNSQEDDKNEFEGSAKVRAKLTYEVARVLANKRDQVKVESQEGDAPQEIGLTERTEAEKSAVFHSVILGMSTSVADNVQELSGQQTILDRQNSLRSIFINYFKTTLYHRVKGVTYRRVLAEQGYDMDKLQDIWTREKRDGVQAAVEKLEELKEEDKTELTELLDCHFDPDKQPIKPATKKPNKRRFQTRRTRRMSPRSMPRRRKSNGHNGGQQHGQNGLEHHQNNRGNNRGGNHSRGTPQKQRMQQDFSHAALADSVAMNHHHVGQMAS
ncbi:maternal protein exuperantia isoform X2 [Phlebotomus argentipes]|uniref:maternal protein exuperantia isoform X2 n=1 Tax=Phlebotomus argentipes TaxID=94469 RepID=UPI0028936E44|nr:maternal protein exuperantia isoform X2 [Phlebotomus argentipes]